MSNFNNNKDKKLRYFLTTYAATTDEGERFLGAMAVITEGTFLNQKRYSKSVMKEAKSNGVTLLYVMLTNFSEISEQDYLEWYE